MPAGPPHTFYEMSSCYRLGTDGSIQMYGSSAYKRTATWDPNPPCLASWEIRTPLAAKSDVPLSELVPLFEAEQPFWMLASRLCGMLVIDLGNMGFRVGTAELRRRRLWRVEGRVLALADHDRAWVSLGSYDPSSATSSLMGAVYKLRIAPSSVLDVEMEGYSYNLCPEQLASFRAVIASFNDDLTRLLRMDLQATPSV